MLLPSLCLPIKTARSTIFGAVTPGVPICFTRISSRNGGNFYTPAYTRNNTTVNSIVRFKKPHSLSPYLYPAYGDECILKYNIYVFLISHLDIFVIIIIRMVGNEKTIISANKPLPKKKNYKKWLLQITFVYIPRLDVRIL